MKRIIYTLFVTVLGAIYVQAQQLTEIFPEAADLDTGSVLWIDYDNDGDQDLLLSGLTDAGNETWMYTNDGDGNFVEDLNTGLPQLALSAMDKADYDKDGDMDLLLTGNLPNATPITKIYINNGDGTFSEDNNNTFTAISLGDCNWIDYDNDNDLDIFITGYDNNEYVSILYQNDGNDIYSEVSGTGLPAVCYSSSTWADYDGDGFDDLFLCGLGWTGEPDIANIYKNNGDGSFTETFSFTSVWLSRATWNDYDGDGDPDLIFSGYNTNSVSRPTSLYKNEDGEFISVAENIIDVSQPAICWGDYDNDGDDDLFIAGAHEVAAGQLLARLYTNLGGDLFEDSNFFFTGVWWADAAWGDIDNDGDEDLVYIGQDDESIKHTFVYRNDVINAIENNFSQEAISVYPNPTTSYITINVFNSSFERASITDVLGNKVWSTNNFNTNRIDVHNLNTGVYFLQLFKDGQSNTIRFIKK